ncbi:UNVERIFIED_CONTAM: hypothetical protein K2H54_057937, partial [Gekko kuhli]
MAGHPTATGWASGRVEEDVAQGSGQLSSSGAQIWALWTAGLLLPSGPAGESV